ncbi:hypothetical protein ETU09_01350 [Apibacter muscae]|uniref:DUF4595 domain-containing protein n=1 Tax=Apibacter muscae TaxID=2509004 RepID=A0A563DKC1_9FLAO|nr:hypothetical protein [Apibacter muscae]TWP30676.1 hypothetical protein ETU09_01350 [Apibacter muscae]
MKKHFLLLNLFFFIAICITSCSSDDNFNEENTISSDKLLPVSILGDNGDKVLYTYNDKNQITELRQEEHYKNYTELYIAKINYDAQGNPLQLITAYEDLETPENEYLWETHNFTYEGNNIVNDIDGDTGLLKYRFTLNNGFVVKLEYFEENNLTLTTDIAYDEFFNAISDIFTVKGLTTGKKIYQYDYSHHSYLKNVSTPDWMLSFIYEDFGRYNQLISTMEESNSKLYETVKFNWDNYQDGFPTYLKKERIDRDGISTITENTITYTKAK